jgi:hypothetical protein
MKMVVVMLMTVMMVMTTGVVFYIQAFSVILKGLITVV